MHAKQADRWIAAVVLLALGVGSLVVLRPFLTAIAWAAILTYSCWPLLIQIEKRTGQHRILASSLLTLLIVLVMLAPLFIVAVNLSSNADQLAPIVESIKKGVPQPPSWVSDIPVVGSKAQAYWIGAMHDKSWIFKQLQALQAPIGRFLLFIASLLGKGILELGLSVFIAFFMFCHGEQLATKLKAVFHRLAGIHGVRLTELAGNTVSGVVYGVIGTALIQAILTGFGLWIAGVPNAALFGLLTFFVSVVPIGPPLVWIPASLWLYFQGSIGWMIFMLIWGALIVSSVDNLLKPALISRGANMPFILVLMGVTGGVLAFGFIGVFIGPTFLALVYSMLQEWTRDQNIVLATADDEPIPESEPEAEVEAAHKE